MLLSSRGGRSPTPQRHPAGSLMSMNETCLRLKDMVDSQVKNGKMAKIGGGFEDYNYANPSISLDLAALDGSSLSARDKANAGCMHYR
ncbi:unnamed protein product, partial [Sphacelaria rigidula]